MWTNVKDGLPNDNGCFLVIVDGTDFAVAYYYKYGGFEVNDDGIVVYADDDSGLSVSLSGSVTHWMPAPTLPT